MYITNPALWGAGAVTAAITLAGLELAAAKYVTYPVLDTALLSLHFLYMYAPSPVGGGPGKRAPKFLSAAQAASALRFFVRRTPIVLVLIAAGLDRPDDGSLIGLLSVLAHTLATAVRARSAPPEATPAATGLGSHAAEHAESPPASPTSRATGVAQPGWERGGGGVSLSAYEANWIF
ncbi:hypothetical protein T492DRAFT_843796 [Pavlovales sp. CCMP2436]|nr:hypothetical protein T492DRAFT_843796 [Pavlovales sp. CCMP2436]